MADQFGLTQSYQAWSQALDICTLTDLSALLQGVKLGSMLLPMKAAVSGITSSAAPQITNGAAAAAGNLGGGTVTLSGVPSGFTYPGTTPIVGGTGNTLPPILAVITLRDAHSNIVVDGGGAAVASSSTYPGTVLLSDDGTTLTFASAVTGFTIRYIPRSFQDLTAHFNDYNQNG
jgi:hypothetical protein